MKRNEISPSISGVIAMRPEPDSASRGGCDFELRDGREILVTKQQPAGELTDAFVARKPVVNPQRPASHTVGPQRAGAGRVEEEQS